MSLQGLSPSESAGQASPPLADRLAELCERAPRNRSASADAALSQALLPLMTEAEREVRQRLAERLASAPWAPHDLVARLALDEIEVARPLLANSPVLVDDDLLAVLSQADIDHRIEVARRPALAPAVAERASADEEPLVLTALAANDRTQLPQAALERLVAAARRAAALRGPLARRRDLDSRLALKLYAVVGEALRASLAERFALPPDQLAQAVSEAVAAAGEPMNADRFEMERRLVAKLNGAAELRPGFLVKSLREGRLGLFEEALGVLAKTPRAWVTAGLRRGSPEALALACAAAGLDRSAFPTILSLVRRETGGSPGEDADSPARVRAAFTGDDARERLRLLMGGLA